MLLSILWLASPAGATMGQRGPPALEENIKTALRVTGAVKSFLSPSNQEPLTEESKDCSQDLMQTKPIFHH